VLRPFEGNPTKAQHQLGLPGRPIGACHNINDRSVDNGPASGGDVHACTVRQHAIMHAPRQQMEACGRYARPFGVDVAFAIVDHCDHCGRRQDLLGPIGRADPSLRFLLLQRSPGVRHRHPARARPNLAGNQTQACVTVGIHGDHRMQQQAVSGALANLAQPAPALGLGSKVDFTCVLDRQYVAASRCNRRLFAPACQQRFQAHVLIGEKPAIADDLGSIAIRRSPQTRTGARDHAFEQGRPPLSRRPSPNRPTLNCSSNILALQ
jgi:hypothetical protein